jgi:hypothetical protein
VSDGESETTIEVTPAEGEILHRIDTLRKLIEGGAGSKKSGIKDLLGPDFDLNSMLQQAMSSKADLELVKQGMAATQKNMVVLAAKLDRIQSTVNQLSGRVQP